MPGPATPANGTLPQGIEIFKAGRRIDDQGRAWDITAEQVAKTAELYDPALRDAPLTVGHPESNRPAYGWVSGLQANGGTLTMNTRAVEAQFAELVRTHRVPKRSAAFYSPEHPNNPTPGHWYLRHVAFLGAQPPAVPGLKDIEFSDQATGLVCFSESTKDPMDKTAEDLAAEKARADQAVADAAKDKARADAAEAQLAKFAEDSRKARHTTHVAFAEEQMKAGKLARPDVAKAVAVLDMLGDLADGNVSFSEGGETKQASALQFVKDALVARNPLVSFGEQLPGNAGGGAASGAAGRTDAEIDRDAKAYAAKHSVSYSEALSKVVAFTTA
jgi:hypothetical protein